MRMALGLDGYNEIPAEFDVDMGKNLMNMWHKKLLRVWKDDKRKFGTTSKIEYSAEEAEKRWVSLQTMTASEDLKTGDPAGYYYLTKVKPYANHEKKTTSMDINEFVHMNDRIISSIRKNLNWAGIQEEYDLSPKALTLLKNISNTIDGKDLTSYSLTELMEDSENGEFNVKLMDFYLRYGGQEFVGSFPALYDGWTSHGPYQFTSNALYDKDDHQEGASRMNMCAMLTSCIPGSVVDMTFEDHSKAAFLFGLHNISRLLSKCSNEEIETLGRHVGEKRVKEVIVQFIAMAHNNPGAAIHGCRNWISGKKKVVEETRNRRHKLIRRTKRVSNNCQGEMYPSVQNPSVRQYGKKTHINLAALEKQH